MTGGQPTKYKPEYCEQIIEYFATFEMYDKEKCIPARPPSLAKFGQKIGVSRDTLNEWTRVHPKFSDSWAYAKALYEDIIRDGAMIGMYRENVTKLVLSHNFGYAEKSKTENEIKFPTGVNITFKGGKG